MNSRDKRFPIVFIIVALVLTFGVFLINSLSVTMTGYAVNGGETTFAFVLLWILLIVFTLIVGALALKHGRQK